MELVDHLQAVQAGSPVRENIIEPNKDIQSDGTCECRREEQINLAREANPKPPRTRINTTVACRRCAQERDKQKIVVAVV